MKAEFAIFALFTALAAPAVDMLSQLEAPMTNSISRLDEPVTNVVSQLEAPVTNAVPQLEAPMTNVVSQLDEPATNAEKGVQLLGDGRRVARQTKITSANTFYDRKEGYAAFVGRVHVDDERYQLHADKAYVFMSSTNTLRRLVAIGNVAMTNDTKRAYGAKVSYYRESGMVVLYSGDGRLAEVRDESKRENQVVTGDKIKFWTDKEQVEVVRASITAPSGGLSKEVLKLGK